MTTRSSNAAGQGEITNPGEPNGTSPQAAGGELLPVANLPNDGSGSPRLSEALIFLDSGSDFNPDCWNNAFNLNE